MKLYVDFQDRCGYDLHAATVIDLLHWILRNANVQVHIDDAMEVAQCEP